MLLGCRLLIVRVDQRANDDRRGCQIAQKFETLGLRRRRHQAEAGSVSTRPIETVDQANLHRVAAGGENDGNFRGRCLRRQSRRLAAYRHKYVDLVLHEVGRHRRQPAVLALRPPIQDADVLPFDKATLV